MGPLVPDIVSNDLNLIVAIIVGILFGAVLEQAGLATSKKLVGLFYGYDFTVLKVFFTAGIVAMVGVMALSHFGLLDIGLIYINPTYLWSAIVGGLIMGLGFVVGGYCPGTSVCAAATGKIDATIFVGGAFIGVVLFGETYGMVEGLYKAAFLGSPRIFDTLGVSQAAFALALIVAAWVAFVAGSALERRVNRLDGPILEINPTNIAVAVATLALGVSVLYLPDRQTYLTDKYRSDEVVTRAALAMMTTDELAFRLMDERETRLQVIDFRSVEAFAHMSLPKSVLFSTDNLFEKEPNQLLMTKNKINVFIAENETEARRMALIATELGYRNIRVLAGGLSQFKKDILEFDHQTVREHSDAARFRAKASRILPAIMERSKSTGPVKKTQKRVIGGC